MRAQEIAMENQLPVYLVIARMSQKGIQKVKRKKKIS